jgi:hypothetical protein
MTAKIKRMTMVPLALSVAGIAGRAITVVAFLPPAPELYPSTLAHRYLRGQRDGLVDVKPVIRR